MQCYIYKIDGENGKIPTILYRGDNATETILALHGFGGNKDSSVINRLAQRLCDKGYNVLSIDFPAHGESDADCSELTAQRCMADIKAAEMHIKETLGKNLSLFATSFGGVCALNRLSQGDNDFRKVVLRGPAVNMADSLSRCVMQLAPSIGMDGYRAAGEVTMTISKSFTLPYSLYEELKGYNAVRRCEEWNKGNILTIWAENDELVAPADTQEFLRINNSITGFCVKGASHRMTDNADHIAIVINKAEEFYGICAK